MVQRPFDRAKKPVRQNLFFLIFIWLYCFFITKKRRLKIRRIRMEGVKPPFLLLSTHHGFIDFYVAPRVLFPHRANYISELEGFIGREWLYRQVGCLCKRKFTNDLALIQNIRHVTRDNKDIIVIYPEARYCNVGTQSELPESVGKLAKLLKVPVVILNMRGNYLLSPIWNLKKRKVPLEADITQVFTPKELKAASIEEINQKITEYFQYDDYQYQLEKKIVIDAPFRAEGLHKALYHCPHCHQDYEMHSKGDTLFCRRCKKEWQMTVYGQLEATAGETEFPHIPHWYDYQRALVVAEIEQGIYQSLAPVRIESLPNAKGFIQLGEGFLVHNLDGYRLELTEDGVQKTFTFAPLETSSVHTEYDYRKKGPCITLSTLDNTYFLYPLTAQFNVTKVQFATEELYKAARKAKPKRKNIPDLKTD